MNLNDKKVRTEINKTHVIKNRLSLRFSIKFSGKFINEIRKIQGSAFFISDHDKFDTIENKKYIGMRIKSWYEKISKFNQLFKSKYK